MTILLAVDIGNSETTMGAFVDSEIVGRWRFSTDPSRTEDEHGLLISGLLRGLKNNGAEIGRAAICSVVPPVTETVYSALERITAERPFVVGPGIRTGIKIKYDRVQDVGNDRVADAVAVHLMYGGPAIVVDIGTFTVFDAVTEDGTYLGGAIAPGPSLSAESVFLRASQLRRVELVEPPTAIGRNTVHAMQSGTIYGHVSLVEGMIRRFRVELCKADPSRCIVVATGGLASLISGCTDVFDHVNTDLTLIGLRLLYEKNQ